MASSSRELLSGLFDYAGLFPPAKLDMSRAVSNYAAYTRSSQSWMLGRFVVPISRLGEFEEAAGSSLPTAAGSDATADDVGWRLSAIVSPQRPLGEQIDDVYAFNAAHSGEGDDADDAGLAVIDTLELKAGTPGDVDEAMEAMPAALTPFFELDPSSDIRGHLTALAGTGGHAKIRCGGVEPSMIPTVGEIASFIRGCAQSDVPFKFTAGLHHPVRSDRALTYASDAPRGTMHGFLNATFAAALALVKRADAETLEAVLDDRDPGAFVFHEDAIAWRDQTIGMDEIRRVRDGFALSIGSCSFTEPVEDLMGLGVLGASASGVG